jgi:DNA replication protein DnaC
MFKDDDYKILLSRLHGAIETDVSGKELLNLLDNIANERNLSLASRDAINEISRHSMTTMAQEARWKNFDESDITALKKSLATTITGLILTPGPNHNDSTLKYLELLESSIMFGNCAGKTTRLDRLHQNRVFYKNHPSLWIRDLATMIRKEREKDLTTNKKKMARIIRKYLQKSKQYRTLAEGSRYEKQGELDEKLKIHLLEGSDEFWNAIFEFHPDIKNRKFLTEEPECNLIEEIFDDEKKGGTSIIFGGPGYGKSIFLQQITLNFIKRSILFDNQVMHAPKIPIYTSARNLVSAWRETTNSSPPHSLRSTESKEELKKLLCDAACQTSGHLSPEVVNPVLDDCMAGGTWDFTLIIDAYDECSKAEREFITRIIHDDLDDYDIRVIMTSRDHLHSELLESGILPNMLPREDNTNDVRQLWMSFTPYELANEMPKKLANAWGIRQETLLHKSRFVLKDYEEILTHPLFVGFFCMLLEKGALDWTKASENFSSISIGSTKLVHVDFLQKVIEHGLEITISDRNEVGDLDLSEIKNIFQHIALASMMRLKSVTFSDMWYSLERHFEIKITPEVRRIIRENLGVMYAGGSDDSEIKWTHETIKEIAAAELIASWGPSNSWYEKDLNTWWEGRFRATGKLSPSMLTASFCLAYMQRITSKSSDIETNLFSVMASLFEIIPQDFIEQLNHVKFPLIEYQCMAEGEKNQNLELKIIPERGTPSHAFAQNIIDGFSTGYMPYELPVGAFKMDREMLHFLFEASRFATNHDGLCAIKFHRYPLYIRNPPLAWLLSDDPTRGDFSLFLDLWARAQSETNNYDMYFAESGGGKYNPIYTEQDWEEFNSRIVTFEARKIVSNYRFGRIGMNPIWMKISQWLKKLVALSGPSEGDEEYAQVEGWPDLREILTQKLVSEPAKKMLSSLELQEKRNTPLDTQEKEQLAQLLHYRFNIDESQCDYEIPYLEARGMNWFLRLVCALRWNSLEEKSERSSWFEKFRTEPIWESEIEAITRVYGQIPRHAFKFPKEELEKMRQEYRIIK